MAFALTFLIASYANAQFEGKRCSIDGTPYSVMIKKIKVDKKGKVSVSFANDSKDNVNVVLKVAAKVEYYWWSYGEKHSGESSYPSCTIVGTVKPGSSEWSNTFSGQLEIMDRIEVDFDYQTAYVDDIVVRSVEFEKSSRCY